MTHIAQPLLALFLVMFGAGCADDMPVTARYAPADCPPTTIVGDDATTGDVEPPSDAAEPELTRPDPATKTQSSQEKLVDLNSADASELARLPGVGPALAARIIDYRVKRLFEKPEDLRRVRGIGPAKYEKLKSSISVTKRQKRKP